MKTTALLKFIAEESTTEEQSENSLFFACKIYSEIARVEYQSAQAIFDIQRDLERDLDGDADPDRAALEKALQHEQSINTDGANLMALLKKFYDI